MLGSLAAMAVHGCHGLHCIFYLILLPLTSLCCKQFLIEVLAEFGSVFSDLCVFLRPSSALHLTLKME